MGGFMLEMAVKMRQLVTITSVRCYRLASSHPFLVGLVCFLVFLYRSSPFLFSFLVSASPVLICTAVLLGTLLSFGQPNVPEIEKDERISPVVVSLRTEVSGGSIVIQKSDSYSVEKYTEKRGGVLEHSNVGSPVANRTIEVHRDGSIDFSASFFKEMHGNLELEDRVVAKEATNFHVSGSALKNEMNDERIGYDDAGTDNEDLEMENDKSPTESFDSERVNVASLGSPPGSPWKHVKEQEQEEDSEDDEDSDSESDRAESSSPDASMADIMPMLDELHPLLDEDAPHPVTLSHDGSDAASDGSLKSNSDGSLKSNDSSSDSDENMEKDELEHVVEEDNEDADDEDEGQENRDDQTKSAITWTEEDQKNLMDLGTSELERNQRLESLIARRRARKAMSMMAERNFIDLESADLSSGIAPILTARNPFDLPHDSYDDMGLPPIPGSAPSILLARRNPFDLPYDSSEEKPDLLGDSFHPELTEVPPREPFFRRHESFNVGPSFFFSSRQEKQDGRLRPYFLAERMDSEGTSYSSFHRQSSGLSDSKASSVPETDSAASVGDNEEKHLLEENIGMPREPLDSVEEVELGDSAGHVDYKNIYEEDVSRDLDSISMKDDKSFSKVDISQEQKLMSNIEHVGHGSQTSEETDSLELDEVEKRDADGNEEIRSQQIEMESGAKPLSFEEAHISCSMNPDVPETYPHDEAAKQGRYASSSSSLSEVSERMFYEKEVEGLSSLEERSEVIVKDVGISIDPSREGYHFNMKSDSSQKEPVYDSSPSAVRENISLSSISPDLYVGSEIQPTVIKRTFSFAERQLESCREDMEGNTSRDMDGSELMIHSVDEIQPKSMMSINSSDNDIKMSNSSEADEVSCSANGAVVAESMVNHPSNDTKSLDDTVEEDPTRENGREYLVDQSCASVYTDATLSANSVLPPVGDMVISDPNLSLWQAPSSISVEDVQPVNVPYTGIQSMAEHSVDKEVALQPNLEERSSLVSETNVCNDVQVEPEEKQVSSHNESASEERPIAEYGEELVFLDKSVDEASPSRDLHIGQDPAVTLEDIIDDLSLNENLNIPAAQELVGEVLLNTNPPTNPDSVSVVSEAYESRAAEGDSDMERNILQEFETGDQFLNDVKFLAETTLDDDDVDEIKEIDEAFLSELDAVGDFSIHELGLSSHELVKHVASVEKGSPKSESVPTSYMVDVNPERQAVETQSTETIDVMFKKPELASAPMESVSASSDILHLGQFDEASGSRGPVLTSDAVNYKTKSSEEFRAQLNSPLESIYHKHDSSSSTEPEMEFQGAKKTLESHQDEVMQSNSIDRSPEFEETEGNTQRFMQSGATEPDLQNSGDKNLDAEVETPEHLDDAKGENSQK